jgi:hypothetical protein
MGKKGDPKSGHKSYVRNFDGVLINLKEPSFVFFE